MDSVGYYLDGQYDSVRAYEGEAVKLPVYQNPKVTKANMGFSGEVIIPVSAFAGVTKIQSITLSAALSQTNFNVGEAYLAEFDAAAMTLSDKVSVWTPSETNWERYEESLDKSGNSYTAEDIFAVTPCGPAKASSRLAMRRARWIPPRETISSGSFPRK